MCRRILLVVALGAACLAGAAPAASAGGPSPGISQGQDGLVRGNERYVALAAGSATTIQAVSRQSGRVLRHMTLPGAWGIPVVAFDRTLEGLLPDGRTLLLAQPVFTGDSLRKSSTFTLVDVRRMKVRSTIRLPGAFAFDALSPNGRYLYLIEYTAPENPALYRVRVYDRSRTKLLAKVVADRKSWETGMVGSPVSRTWKSAWAYTLYGGNAKPFIHALNTRGVEAVCINLPWTSPEKIFDFRLRTNADGQLVVRGPRGRVLAVIDRATFKVIRAVAHP